MVLTVPAPQTSAELAVALSALNRAVRRALVREATHNFMVAALAAGAVDALTIDMFNALEAEGFLVCKARRE